MCDLAALPNTVAAQSQPPHTNIQPEDAEVKPKPSSTTRGKASKRSIGAQDLQRMQMEVLELEKVKIQLEIENLKLRNKKMRLEINDVSVSSMSSIASECIFD